MADSQLMTILTYAKNRVVGQELTSQGGAKLQICVWQVEICSCHMIDVQQMKEMGCT